MVVDIKKSMNKKEVKKVVVIYPGRFQPFGPHHKKVFDALSKRFDNAYITASDIQRPPRHPLSFKEKEKTYDESKESQVIVSFKKKFTYAATTL